MKKRCVIESSFLNMFMLILLIMSVISPNLIIMSSSALTLLPSLTTTTTSTTPFPVRKHIQPPYKTIGANTGPESKRGGLYQHQYHRKPKDWDIIDKAVNKATKIFDNGLAKGFRRSIQSVTMDTVNPLLYGLSMAAGLAMGVSIADSQPVATLIQKFLPPIQRNSQNHAHPTPNIPTEDPMTALGSSNKPQNIQSSNFPNMTPKVSDDQMTQKLVARSKDGQDHYHHVVHYHIPYPMSVNAFNTAKSLYPNTPWYLSDTTNSGGKPVVVSAYLSPSYRAPDAATSFFDPLMSQLTEDTRRSDTLLSGSSIIETPSATSVAALSSFPTDHYFRDVPKKLKKSSSSGAKSNKNSHSYYGLPSYHPSSSKDYHHSHHHHHHHSSKKDRISASLDDDQTFSGRAFGITSDTHPILPSLVSLQNKPSLASSASSPPPVISSSSHHGSSDKQNSLFSSSSSSPPTLNGTVNSSSYDHHYTNRSQNVNHGVTSDDAVASSSDSDDNDPGMDNLPLESNHHPQHKSSSSVSSAFPSVTTTYFTSTKR